MTYNLQLISPTTHGPAAPRHTERREASGLASLTGSEKKNKRGKSISPCRRALVCKRSRTTARSARLPGDMALTVADRARAWHPSPLRGSNAIEQEGTRIHHSIQHPEGGASLGITFERDASHHGSLFLRRLSMAEAYRMGSREAGTSGACLGARASTR